MTAYRAEEPMQGLRVKTTSINSRNRFKIRGGWSKVANARVVGGGRPDGAGKARRAAWATQGI